MTQNEVVIHTIQHGRILGRLVEKWGRDGRLRINVRISRPFEGNNGPSASNLYSNEDLLYLKQLAQDAYNWIHANDRADSIVEISEESELD